MNNIRTEYMSKLICQMAEKKATEEEFSRAIRYSMAIIDEEKSYEENKIEDLIEKYGEK